MGGTTHRNTANTLERPVLFGGAISYNLSAGFCLPITNYLRVAGYNLGECFVEKIKVLVNGALGKMGISMSAVIAQEPDMELTAVCDIRHAGENYGYLICNRGIDIKIHDNLQQAMIDSKPDVMLDLTNPQSVKGNIDTALSFGVACVVGTTGLSESDKKDIAAKCRESGIPVFLASNFSLGAVLMMRFAAEAANYFPHVEIIERHHDQKLDAPSGTAVDTMKMISRNREIFAQGAPCEEEKIKSSRGGEYEGMRVHSVRLPGYMASQEVVFGSTGQLLTIRHDAMSREAFVPGVLLSIRKVLKLAGLVSGLEELL